MPIKLHDFQWKAVTQLHSGKVLLGGVGTGKSVTALAYFLVNYGQAKRRTRSDGLEDYIPTRPCPDLYIITTARKRDSHEWDGDMSKFSLKLGRNAKGHGGMNITVDSWNNIKKHSDVHGAVFIFDEQRLVGSGAWVRTFYRIAASNDWILLTATPGDTWSDYVAVFVAKPNHFYKNKTAFERRHAVYNRFVKFPQIDHYVDEGHLHRLRSHILVRMDMQRRTKRHYHALEAQYPRGEYKDIFRTRWNKETNEPFENISQVTMAIRRLVNTDPSRMDLVRKLIAEHDRVIIFYNLNVELEQLRQLKDTGRTMAEWNGHMHQPCPTGGRWIYLVQYQSGSEAWNCTTTDTVIFYSLNYSYKTMEQASGRIDRLNTPYMDLHYYIIKSFSPLDVSIMRALKAKKDFQPTRFVKSQLEKKSEPRFP